MEYAVRVGNPLTTLLTPVVDDNVGIVHHVTTLEQKQVLIDDDSKILIVKLGAEWCGPCKNIMPGYKQMALDYKDVVFSSEDVDDDIGNHPVEVKSIPAFHFYKNGSYVFQVVGANLEKVESQIIMLQLQEENK